ncbi:orotidine-5'-phosphate decarboxylase [Myceligenerans salitolerans]|uniref:Orotidine 5'-phosphate decarboxylase n=1 Tax=Myceligenerans salitolerans TaxID=1230528 RepID=A0ABS3IDQ6_9MICO|nr:orotidine-5'-phosphate decarboxylase [Myceligenerans salitolerans]MBO0610157.1 orotidine-5'-phosphate decarboxylase [Myceligenerans salitolerans]
MSPVPPGAPSSGPAVRGGRDGAATVPFGARLAGAMDEHGPLCVGIDPHGTLLDGWGLADTASGVRDFSLRVVEALAGQVAVVKPQAAFYERHGSAGLAALEETLAAARAAGLLTIVDAKRGDIGSTMSAYADAFLRDGSPLAGDALTVSPYLGFGSLRPAVDLAAATGRGLFVLCLTSNPEGPQVQHARSNAGPGGTGPGPSVAALMAAHAAALNAGAAPMGSVGLVVGATIGDAVVATGVDLAAVNGPLLAPGVGAQGAGEKELATTFGAARGQVLASSSRAILRAGPAPGDLRAAARRAAGEATRALRG